MSRLKRRGDFLCCDDESKEKLYLLYPKQRYNKDTTRSRFIEELLTARYPLLRTDLHTP